LLLVAIGPSNSDLELIRAGKRLAEALRAPWAVAGVEPSAFRLMPVRERQRHIEFARIAESLGAEAVTLRGVSSSRVIASYARVRQARMILVGAPARLGWHSLAHIVWMSALKRRIAGTAVIAVAADSRAARSERAPAASSLRHETAKGVTRGREYLWALGVSACCAAVVAPMPEHVDLMNIAMVYLLGAAIAGLLLRRGPAAVTAVTNILAFDYFDVPPRFSLLVAEPSYFVTFGEMLLVALIIPNLMIAVRDKTAAASARERHAAALYAITRDLVIARDTEAMIVAAVRHIREILHCDARVVLCEDAGRIDTQSVGSLRRLLLRAGEATLGVLIVEGADPGGTLQREQQQLLEAIAEQLAHALQRARMAELADSAQLDADAAAMRNTVLASIAHDLRAPLAAIAGAGSIVAQGEFALDHHRRVTLGRLIEEKALELSDVLANMLELVRLESGVDALDRDWDAVAELVSLAIERHKVRLEGYAVNLDLPADLPLVPVDANLMVKLFSNLLHNATRFTPPGTRIDIRGRREGAVVRVVVEDAGPGFERQGLHRIFATPACAAVEGGTRGIGLGLALCRAVARRHGGEICAGASSLGGARFEITIPLLDNPSASKSPLPVT
jgi:two-component system sensor histidine kinase KdpD